MKKKNLIIIHAHATNGILLKELYEFLSNIFTVYPINLPGFVPNKKPLKNVTLPNYAAHVDSEIKKLNLKSYLLAGISLGFAITGYCKLDERCKGIIAIAPYINTNYTKNNFQKFVFKIFAKLVTHLGIHNYVYHSFLNKMVLRFIAPKGKADIMQKTINGYAFYETSKLLFTFSDPPIFHKKPYVLIINKDDETMEAKKIIKLFKKKDNLIIKIALPHYPKNLSREFFEKNIDLEEVDKINEFLSGK
ncbi:MAG: hypothetical protein AAF335_01285 [Bacteroidota bacterium]